MRFGIRKFSINKSIAARISLKRRLRHNYRIKMPRGGGFLTNPKKASYNYIYRRGSVSLFGFIGKLLGRK